MEILFVIAAFAAGLLPLVAGREEGRKRRAVLAGFAVACALGAGAWHLTASGARRAAARIVAAAVPRPLDDGTHSTSAACQACHPGEHASWHASFHRTMTRAASPETVKGAFDGRTLEAHGRAFRFERRGDAFWIEMPDPDWEWERLGARTDPADPPSAAPRVWKQVVMTTGSHHQQICWVAGRHGNELEIVPAAFLLRDRRWVPLREIFLWDEGRPLHLSRWNASCVHCHSTRGIPAPAAGGEGFDTRAAELGIACEACHGPGEEHVRANRDPLRRYARHLGGGPDPTIVNPARLDHRAASQVCGLCHGLFQTEDFDGWLRRGFTFRPGMDLEALHPLVHPRRPGSAAYIAKALAADPSYVDDRFWPDGMIRVLGREYNALAETACFTKGEMSCLSCHELHGDEPDDQLHAAGRGDGSCLGCHDPGRYRVEAHTRHAPGSSGASCLNCHMPYATWGLLKAVRSHQITSPSVASTLDTGRPNACNLCHLDRTLAWTQERLQTWYGIAPRAIPDEARARVAAAIVDMTRGDCAQRALAAWAAGWEPARAASGADWLAPFVARLLDDRYSAVRYAAARSLAGLPGAEGVVPDPFGEPESWTAAQQQVMLGWRGRPAARPGPKGAEVLIRPDGSLDLATLKRLVEQRVERPLHLAE